MAESSRLIRISAFAMGAIMVLAALLGHRLDLSKTPGLGTVEALALVCGVCCMLVAWAGPRTPALYSRAAIMLLNTIVLLAVVELGSAVLLSVMGPRQTPRTGDVGHRGAAYDLAEGWAVAFEREFPRARRHDYHPYLLWRMAPYRGNLIHVGPDGLRQTPGADCAAGAYVVDVFGGSTVWGFGVPDSATVPAYLQIALHQALRSPVCVRNFGQLGGTSTQDLIALVRELQAGRIPDAAVFLGGVNEVMTAFRAGEAGAHARLDMFRQRFDGHTLGGPARRATLNWLANLNIHRLAIRILPPRAREVDQLLFQEEIEGFVSDTLAESVVRVWLANYRTVEGMAGEYDFAHAFFWQPNLLVGRKPLSEAERRMKEIERPIGGLIELVDRRLPSIKGPDYRGVHSLVDVFADDSARRYFDWHHLTPAGNRIVANAMADVVVGMLKERAARRMARGGPSHPRESRLELAGPRR
jgi:lysophospholipase L1-like esterase